MIETYIKINGQYQPAVMTLATPADLVLVDAWVEEYEADETPETNDIREYVDSSLEKQEKYAGRNRCPAEWTDFLARASQWQEDEEIAGLFVLKCAALADEILGFTFLRRTWDGSLVMDYLARCPAANPRLQTTRGIGIGLLVAVCKLAELLQAPYLWWETTRSSCKLYWGWLNKAGIVTPPDEPASTLIIAEVAYLRFITYSESPLKNN